MRGKWKIEFIARECVVAAEREECSPRVNGAITLIKAKKPRPTRASTQKKREREIGNGDQLELTFPPRLFSFYFHRKGNRAGIYSNTSSFIGMQRGKKEENKYR